MSSGLRAAGEVQVQVAAEHVPAARARLIALARAQLLEAKRALALDSVLLEVELVAAQLRAGLAEHRIPHELGLDVADDLELLFHRCLAGQHIAHRVFRAREILERVHEVHVAAAFCVDGHALFRGLLDGEGKEGYIFFRPESVTVSEEMLDGGLYPNHLVMNNVEVRSAEYTGPGYVLGLWFKGLPIIAFSPLKPKKRYISLMIMVDALIKVQS